MFGNMQPFCSAQDSLVLNINGPIACNSLYLLLVVVVVVLSWIFKISRQNVLLCSRHVFVNTAFSV
jgi:hypothetical protein